MCPECRRSEATYEDVGRSASRVDYILVRYKQAQGDVKTQKQLHFASWRQGARHYALAGCIKFFNWKQAEPKHNPIAHFDREEAAKAVAPGPEQERLRAAFVAEMKDLQQAPDPEQMEGILLNACSQAFPKRTQQEHPKPWQQPETLCDLRKVWQLRNSLQATKNGSQSRSPSLGQTFKAWRLALQLEKATKSMKRNSRIRRRLHWNGILQEAEAAQQAKNPLKFFQILNRLAPKRQYERTQIRDAKGRILTPAEECQALAEYWSKIYSGTALASYQWWIRQPLDLTRQELLHALLALKIRKAVAPGMAPACAWRALAPEMSQYLCDLLSHRWSTGNLVIPQHWTDSVLHFLTKPGKPAKQVQDLRPIALQSAAAKTVTSVLRDRIKPYCQAALLMVPQYAYVAQRSTIEAIARVAMHCSTVRSTLAAQALTVHEKFAGATRSSCIGGAQISIDLSKAFDQLPRCLLLQILLEAHIPEDEVHLIVRWHQQGRYRILDKSTQQASTVPLHQGVRQGCVLSPILWSLYTAFLTRKLNEINGEGWTQQHGTFYADDFHFQWQFHSIEELRATRIQVANIYATLKNLGMQANPSKSTFLLSARGYLAKKWVRKFIRKNKNGERRFYFGGRPQDQVPVADSFVYLGAVLSYQGFEEATIRHRLGVAAGQHERLRRVLHARKVMGAHTRFRLWKVMVQTSQLYAVEAVGMTKEGARLIYAQTMRHLRGIFGSARHVDGLSDKEFLHKFGLPHPHAAMLSRFHVLRDRLAAPSQDIPCFDHVRLHDWVQVCLNALPEPYEARQRPPPDTAVAEEKAGSVAKAFACSQCHLTFQTLHELKTHEGKTHKIIRERQLVETHEHGFNGLPTCRHCGQHFSKWHALNRHISRQGCSALEQGQKDAYAKSSADSVVDAPCSRPELIAAVKTGGWKALAANQALCTELKQRCVLCYQWIAAADGKGIKLHMQKAHSQIRDTCLPDMQAQFKIFKRAAISPCTICGVEVKDARQHGGQCPVLYQILLMTRHLTGNCGEGRSSQAADGGLRQHSAQLLFKSRALQHGNYHGHTAGAQTSDARSPAAAIPATAQGEGKGTESERQPSAGGGQLHARSPEVADHAFHPAGGSPFQTAAGDRVSPHAAQRQLSGMHPQGSLGCEPEVEADMAGSASRLGQVVASNINDMSTPGASSPRQELGRAPRCQGQLSKTGMAQPRGLLGLSNLGPRVGDAKAGRIAQTSISRFFGGPDPKGIAHDTGSGQADPLPGGPQILRRNARPHCGLPDRHRPQDGLGSPACADQQLGGPFGMAPGGRQTASSTSESVAGRRTAVDVVVAQLKLGNSGNVCYLNSCTLACMHWLITGTPWDGEHEIKQALLQLTRLDISTVHYLTQMLTWRSLLRDWSQPHIQHDASECLLHLLRLGSGMGISRWRSVTRHGQQLEVEDSGQYLIHMAIPGTEGEIAMTDVIQAWHSQSSNIWQNSECLHCIQGDETHLAIALKRFAYTPEGCAKNSSPIRLEGSYMMPLLTGDQIHWAPFSVQAAIIHLGATPSSGHYRAQVNLSTGVFYTNDGVRARKPSKQDKMAIMPHFGALSTLWDYLIFRAQT